MRKYKSFVPSIFLMVLCLAVISASLSFSDTPGVRGIRVIPKKGASLYLYKDYHALVVGVSDYERWPKLRNAVSDAREVAERLRGLGFEVKLVENPTYRDLKTALSDLAFRIGGEKDRGLLFYFAGHGETLKLADGTELGYIIPRDCPLKREDPLGFDSRAISMREVEDYALKTNSKHLLMVFDSCFSGSLFNLRGPGGAPVDITEKSATPVRQFITAGAAGEQVPDCSVFKVVFLDGIGGEADFNRDGYVTGSELGMHLQDKVVNYSGGSQHPQYGKIRNPKLDKGDFVFVPPKVASLPPEPPPPPPPPPPSVNIPNIAGKWWRVSPFLARTNRIDLKTTMVPVEVTQDGEKFEYWLGPIKGEGTINGHNLVIHVVLRQSSPNTPLKPTITDKKPEGVVKMIGPDNVVTRIEWGDGESIWTRTKPFD